MNLQLFITAALISSFVGCLASTPQNVARNKTTQQSSTFLSVNSTTTRLISDHAVDGDFDFAVQELAHTNNRTGSNWWRVDLGQQYKIGKVVIFSHSSRDDSKHYILTTNENPPPPPSPINPNWEIVYYIEPVLSEQKEITLYLTTPYQHLALYREVGDIITREVEVYSWTGDTPQTQTHSQTADQLSVYYGANASLAVDGKTDMMGGWGYYTSTAMSEYPYWWRVSLKEPCTNCYVRLYPNLRPTKFSQGGFSRLSLITVSSSSIDSPTIPSLSSSQWNTCYSFMNPQNGPIIGRCEEQNIKHVAVLKNTYQALELVEVEVFHSIEDAFNYISLTAESSSCVKMAWSVKPNHFISYFKFRCTGKPAHNISSTVGAYTQCGYSRYELVTCKIEAIGFGSKALEKTTHTQCEDETKHLYLRSDQSVTDQIKIGQCKLRLGTGVTEFEITDGCYQNFNVHEWSLMPERRAYLEAEYRFDCKPLSKLSYLIIESDAKQHTTYLKLLCSGCEVNVSSPDISCFNDTLILNWKTSITADQQERTSDMISKLESSVREFESKSPAIDLRVIHTTLRIASPVRQKSGLYLKVDIRTSCQKEGYVYNKNSDACEKIAVGVAEVHCPTDMKLILPHNVNQLNITLPQPQINDTRLSCVECPDSVHLDAGAHNMTFSYIDNIYNQTIECSYLITVSQQPATACHNETKRLFLKPNKTNTDEIQIADSGFSISFDEGKHKVKIRDGCYITYIVNEMSTMKRQVQLEAEYGMKCQSLSKISLSIIDSYLLQHTQNIRKYCPVCQIDGSPYPLIQCTNDTLIASWNTGITGNHQVMRDDIRNKLHSALVEFQNKYPVMDITIFTTLPRTVSPIKDSDGLNLRFVIKTTCADREFQYNKQYDVCERAQQ